MLRQAHTIWGGVKISQISFLPVCFRSLKWLL